MPVREPPLGSRLTAKAWVSSSRFARVTVVGTSPDAIRPSERGAPDFGTAQSSSACDASIDTGARGFRTRARPSADTLATKPVLTSSTPSGVLRSTTTTGAASGTGRATITASTTDAARAAALRPRQKRSGPGRDGATGRTPASAAPKSRVWIVAHTCGGGSTGATCPASSCRRADQAAVAAASAGWAGNRRSKRRRAPPRNVPKA